MNRIKTLIFTVLFFFLSSAAFASSGAAKSDAIEINIEARSNEERALVKMTLEDIYPFLPFDQQELIRQGLYFAVYEEGPLEFAFAFGPEDDPDYRYPDKTLYPNGTIKVNFTLHALRQMQEIYGTQNSPDKASNRRFMILEMVAHEIKHVQQYIANPLHALANAEECPSGLCDTRRLSDTEIKMMYEFQAIKFGWEVAVNAIRKEGASVSYRDEPLPKSAKWFYSAMYIPAVLAKECIEKGALNEGEKEEARLFVGEHQLEKYYPYLTPIIARLKPCVQ